MVERGRFSHCRVLLLELRFYYAEVASGSSPGHTFEVLQQKPDIKELVFPRIVQEEASRRWASRPCNPDAFWTVSDLRAAFERLLCIPSLEISLFIDGLDEYEGDDAQIAELFRWFLASPGVKTCLSSRPLLTFERTFSQCPTLHLQNLTYDDISRYVTDKLDGCGEVQNMRISDPVEFQHLAEEIIDKADGVFLWVTLAVRSLLEGLSNFGRMSDLRFRLKEIPEDLSQLYWHIPRSIKPAFYFTQAAKLLKIMHAAYCSNITIPTEFLAFSEEFELGKPIKEFPEGSYRDAAQGLAKMMEGRLMSRCRGLLEVREGCISFLHQSVPDFLVQLEVITALDKEAQGHFNPHASILAAHLTEIKNLSDQEMFECSRRPEWLVRLEALFLLARKADEELGHVAHGLLDKFDSIFPRVYYEYINQTNRTSFRIIPYNQDESDTFTTICLQNGVINYVSAKLDAGESLYQSRDRVPILQFLVDPVFFKEWSYEQTNVRKEGYAKVLEVYQLVLAHGAKPNEPYPSHWFPCTTSPWVRLIKYAVIGSQTMTDMERGELPPFLPCPLLAQSPFWLDVMNLFLDHGANPSAGLPAWKDGSREAIVVNPLAMLLTDEAIATDKVKANSLRKRLVSLGGATEPYIIPFKKATEVYNPSSPPTRSCIPM